MRGAGVPNGDRWSFYLLMAGLAASFLLLVLLVRRRSLVYPVAAVPGILLLAHLGGIALIQGNRTPMYAWYALPYSIAAVASAGIEVAALLAGGRRFQSLLIPTAVLALLAAGSAAAVVKEANASTRDPALGQAFARTVSAAVPAHRSVLGEWLYWWGFRNQDFHYDSLIWLYRWQHHATLEQSFNHLCPDYVLYDGVWASRYPQAQTFGKRFPSMAPTDEGEGAQLTSLLRREYRLRVNETLQGRMIQLWQRKVGACSGVLTDGGGTS